MQTNYNKPFEISQNIGNNVFCFNKKNKPKIYIPNLIQSNLEDFQNNISNYIKIWNNTAFREEKKWEIIKYKWLQNFIVISSGFGSIAEDVEKSLSANVGKNKKEISPLQSKWQTIYIFDNHNHALYFRYKEYFEWHIKKWINLIHIDQHSDMNENKFISKKNDNNFSNLESVFQFTNYNCNVWNFIKPAIEEWLIWNITQINTEYSLINSKFSFSCHSEWNEESKKENSKQTILDIDLDFRAPEMSIEKYQETISITKKLIQNSGVVTIATSPYFLDQNLAIKIIQDLFQK